MKQFYSQELSNGATLYSIIKTDTNQLMTEQGMDIMFISMVNFARPNTATRTIKFRYDYLKQAGMSFDAPTVEYIDTITLDIISKFKN